MVSHKSQIYVWADDGLLSVVANYRYRTYDMQYIYIPAYIHTDEPNLKLLGVI